MFLAMTLKNLPPVFSLIVISMLLTVCHMPSALATTTTTTTKLPVVSNHRQQQQQQQQTHWPQQRNNRPTTRNSVQQHWRAATTTVSGNSPITTTINCNYKELLANMQDHIKLLIKLNEGQSNRLENMEKKLVQFEASNLGRMESLSLQQTDFHKTLNNLDHVQRLTRHSVEMVLKQLDEYLKKSNYTEFMAATNYTNVQNNDLDTERYPRQTAVPLNQWNDSVNLSNDQKLDALAILLVSTRKALNGLQNVFQMNISRLLQQTGNLQRRFNNLARRQFNGDAGNFPPHHYGGFNSNNPQTLITNCAESVPSTLGILKVQLTTNSEPFYVRCDEQLLGGGWTVILNRFSGDINFERSWLDYKQGFGNLAGEFFIGLDKLYALTNANEVHELLIVLEDFQSNRRYARYNLFAIGSEQELYELKLLGSYTGDAGDSFSYHAGSKFSTFDNDNDGCVDCNCAQSHKGAWWYNWCEQSNLMGPYYASGYDKIEQYRGMYWQNWLGPNYSLKAARMMIRPVNYEQNQRRR